MGNSKKNNYNNPNRKTRSYLQVIYEESAPQNFVELLKQEVDKGTLRYFILSPWHDRDWYTVDDEKDYLQRLARQQLDVHEMTNPVKAGTYKKCHCHMIAERTNNIQQIYANDYFQKLTNGSFVKPRENLRGAVRYLAHLDENPMEKALYNPDLIYAYGDIKIDRFLNEEDKSMSSTTAWFTLQDMVDEYCFTNIVDFEHHMRTQDIDLQIQLQKNANLRTRVYNYINAKRMLETEKSILNNGAMDRAVARKEIDKAVEKKLVSFEYAQKQIENLYAQK